MTNYNFYTGQKWGKASNYTLCLNSSQLGYLPLGSYYVKELKAPDGFVSSDLKFKYNIKFFLCHVIVPPLFCDNYRSRSLVFNLTGSGICI